MAGVGCDGGQAIGHKKARTRWSKAALEAAYELFGLKGGPSLLECSWGPIEPLKAAIDYALAWGLETTWKRVRELGERLRVKFRVIPGDTVHDLGERKCGIVTFAILSLTSQEVHLKLQEKQMNVSVSLPEYSRLDMD